MTASEPKTTEIAATENYLAWKAEEPDETTFHLDVENVTLHFFKEEWDEFIDLMKLVIKNQ
jgi:hypothetical protein